MAQHHATGQIPLAAAHAASGLHLLLGVIAASQDAVTQGDVDTLAAQAEHLEAAPEELETAISNTDILMNMLKWVDLQEALVVGMPTPRERAAGAGEADGGGRGKEGAEGPAA